MNEILLEDAAARRAATDDLRVNIMLDAGAGTGKTAVMVQRILNLLMSGVPLDRIVAITFTEKAAGELQVRVRDAIEKRLRAEPDETIGERLRQALRDIERANVSTIHAFCARLLRERPIEAGAEPGFTVFDELSSFLLQNEVWDQWFGEALDRQDPALVRAIDLEVSSVSLRNVAFRFLDQRDLLDLLPARHDDPTGAFLARVERDLAWLQKQTLCCTDTTDGALLSIQGLERDLARARSMRGEDRDRFLLFGWSIRHGRGSRTKWSPPERVKEIKDRLQELRSELEALQASLAHNIVVDVHEWLAGYIRRYRDELRARGGIDFTDLLLCARNLLRDRKDVRGDLQRRFSHLLVDEFQDTDPLQAEIVFFLGERTPRADRWDEVDLDPGKLFVVGDPKQSIYRFRRADIEMYEAAKRVLAQQGEALTLSTNFRSAGPVVDWINRVFAQLIQRPEAGDYQPEYAAIRACPEAPSEGAVMVVPVAGEEEDREGLLASEARHFAFLIQRAVEAGWMVTTEGRARPLEYRDVAVLFRANEPMRVYEEAFREFEIPYRIAGGQRFYQREEVTALQALVRALANPGDDVAVVATLRGPFLGVSDEDLFLFRAAGGSFNYAIPVEPSLPRSELFREAFDLLLRFHRRTPEVPPSMLLADFFAETRLLPLLALQAQGDQRVANLLKVVNFARTLAAERGLTFRGFVRTLDYMANLQAEESDSPVAEECDDVVRLLTIHKAKGLEFPLVILANGGQKIDARIASPIVDRLAGRLGLGLPIFKRSLHSDGWDELKRREAERTQAEARRLLYVAATRARDYLLLPCWPEKARGEFLNLLLQAGEASVYDEPLAAAPRRPQPFRVRWGEAEEEIAAGVAVGGSEAERDVEGWRAARQALVEGAAPELDARSVTSIKLEAEETPVHFRGRGGAQMGTAVHQILRRVTSPEDVPRLVPGVCRSLGIGPSSVKKVADLAQRAFSLPVAARLAQADEVFREVPFTWRDGNRLIEGQIDLAFRSGGALVVVDYKTDDVNPGRQLEKRAREYRPQAVAYAMALERISGLPVSEVVLAFLRPGVEHPVRSNWEAEWDALRARLGRERSLSSQERSGEVAK